MIAQERFGVVDLLDIETRVLSRIKNKFPKKLKDTFPNINFTNDDRLPDNPSFPTVYVHELLSVEKGNDLDNVTINAVLSTFQIEVYDNVSSENAKIVMNYVCETMKSMGFTIISMPEFRNNQSYYRRVARFKRMIGSGDTL